MAGEPSAVGNDMPPSAGSQWTLETLRALLSSEIKAGELVNTARFISGDTRAAEAQEAIKVGLANAQRALDAAAVLAKDAVGEAKVAHAAEHTAQAMALALAQLEMKERLVEMNAFRKQIADERGDFVTRDRLSTAISTMEGAIAVSITAAGAHQSLTDARITELATVVTSMQSRFTAYGTAFGIAVILFEIFWKVIIK